MTGIVNALSTGDIQLAGAIALGALKSMFLQALAEIPYMGQLLSTGFVRRCSKAMGFNAAIGIANVKLRILEGWNAVASIWSTAMQAWARSGI